MKVRLFALVTIPGVCIGWMLSFGGIAYGQEVSIDKPQVGQSISYQSVRVFKEETLQVANMKDVGAGIGMVIRSQDGKGGTLVIESEDTRHDLGENWEGRIAFSPDGNSVAFITEETELLRVQVIGEAATEVKANPQTKKLLVSNRGKTVLALNRQDEGDQLTAFEKTEKGLVTKGNFAKGGQIGTTSLWLSANGERVVIESREKSSGGNMPKRFLVMLDGTLTEQWNQGIAPWNDNKTPMAIGVTEGETMGSGIISYWVGTGAGAGTYRFDKKEGPGGWMFGWPDKIGPEHISIADTDISLALYWSDTFAVMCFGNSKSIERPAADWLIKDAIAVPGPLAKRTLGVIYWTSAGTDYVSGYNSRVKEMWRCQIPQEASRKPNTPAKLQISDDGKRLYICTGGSLGMIEIEQLKATTK